jgi:hypothetical protein
LTKNIITLIIIHAIIIMNQSYCLTCKTKTGSINPKLVHGAKRDRVSSQCSECGGNKSSFDMSMLSKSSKISEQKRAVKGKGIGYNNGPRVNDGQTRYGMGMGGCGNCMKGGCADCGGRNCIGHGVKRGGSSFQPGTAIYERAPAYMSGSALVDGSREEYYVDRYWYHEQDLNEYQDELTDMRIKFMNDIYQMNTSRDNEGDALANDPLDATEVDNQGNIIKEPNDEIEILSEQAKPNQTLIGEQVETESRDEDEDEDALTSGSSFYVQPIKPVMRQGMLDPDWTDRYENERQYDNEKFVGPLKRYNDDNPLMDMISMRKSLIQHEGGYIPESEIIDPWVIWRERNGYKEENNQAYNDDMVRRRQEIYRSQTADINQFEFPENPPPRWSLTLENDISREQGRARTGRNNRLEILTEMIKEEDGVMPYDFLTDQQQYDLQNKAIEESMHDNIDPNHFAGENNPMYQDTMNTQEPNDEDNTPFNYGELDSWVDEQGFTQESFNQWYFHTPFDQMSTIDRKRIQELRYLEEFDNSIFYQIVGYYMPIGLASMGHGFKNSKNSSMKKKKTIAKKRRSGHKQKYDDVFN